MTLFGPEDIYARLPAIVRLRDGQSDNALRALFGILGEQSSILEEDVRRLYDDQFIETCAPWLTPYIGDLIGYRPIHSVTPEVANPRALVASEIARRRRKGTIVVIEALARDVTGWSAHAVEYFQRLIWNQNMNHIRTHSTGTPHLRAPDPFHPVERAFDTNAHTVDTGRIAVGEGKYNVRNVGVHLWRLFAVPVRNQPAAQLDARRWFFSPLTADLQLYSQMQTEPDITRLSTPFDVPDSITLPRLSENLGAFYPRDLSLRVNGVEVPASQIRVCHLGDDGPGWAHDPPDGIAIDPERGRIAFPSAVPPPEAVEATYHYATPFFLGGGSYERADDLDVRLTPEVGGSGGAALQPLLDGITGGGVIQIEDSGIYTETVAFNPDADARVGLRAANEQRPALISGGEILITGGASSEVILNGLLISGGAIRIPADAGVRRVILSHLTLVPGISLNTDATPLSPGAPSLIIEAPRVTVSIRNAILGGIRCHPDSEVVLENSIVDAGAPENIAFSDPDDLSAGGSLRATAATIIGKIHAGTMPLISNAILFSRLAAGDPWPVAVRSARRQIGCVRFSVLPAEARTPRRHRCLPDIAPEAEKRWAATPLFTDMRYGRPAFMQLSRGIYPGVATGADDESEMGAYHDLFAPQRVANLKLRLEEYLPVGLEAGILFET